MVAVGFALLAAPLRAQFVYVTAWNDTISAYSIASNGALIAIPGSPYRSGGRISAVDPAGRFVYVDDIGLFGYSIASNGALTPIPGYPLFPDGTTCSLTVEFSGKFLYLASSAPRYGVNSISAYSIASNGAVTPVPGSPFSVEATPSSATVDSSGKFLYVANREDTISAYNIASNGALTPVPGSPFPAGFWPVSVTVDPTGKFVYVANSLGGSGTISAYNIASNGALTPVPGSPFAAEGGADSVAVDPTGKFVYVANFYGGWTDR
jgi:6-phosphogluconolactonase (cycloisomerase 2 family)